MLVLRLALKRGRAMLLALSACACAGAGEVAHLAGKPNRGELRVVAVHPHDAAAFTQGLVWYRGRLLESLGLEGSSSLREVELASGRVVREVLLPAREFGEGLALAGDRLFQLTWRNERVHVWRLENLSPVTTHAYTGEGWGLAFDGKHLIQSDGSASLTLRSPVDFSVLGTLRVRKEGRPAPFLNELEFVNGFLYANVWQSDEIYEIDPATGDVVTVWSADGLLLPEERAAAEVLNGIAWVPERGRFLITGKRWPKLFEVELAGGRATARSDRP